MYIANRPDCITFKGCSLLQFSCNLAGLKPATAYLPYTYRYMQAKNQQRDEKQRIIWEII